MSSLVCLWILYRNSFHVFTLCYSLPDKDWGCKESTSAIWLAPVKAFHAISAISETGLCSRYFQRFLFSLCVCGETYFLPNEDILVLSVLEKGDWTESNQLRLLAGTFRWALLIHPLPAQKWQLIVAFLLRSLCAKCHILILFRNYLLFKNFLVVYIL